jgi:hypothetical protein
MLGSASVALFWVPLHQLSFSHIVLIPAISAFFMYRERRRIFSRIAFGPAVGLPFLAAALAMYGVLALRIVRAPMNYSLSIDILANRPCLACGIRGLLRRADTQGAMFPLLSLLLLVPVPFNVMDWIVSVLQRG